MKKLDPPPFITGNVMPIYLYALGLCLLIWPASFAGYAQNTSSSGNPNAEILKMLKAQLPEAVVLNKIRGSRGSFDTSTDALIVLKQAGATDTELTALTEPVNGIAPKSGALSTASTPPLIPLMGGLLGHTENGTPYLHFESNKAEIFPSGVPSNTAFFTRYENQSAVVVPSSMQIYGYYDCFSGNLIVTERAVFFDPLVEGCGNDKKARPYAARVLKDKKGVPYPSPWVFTHDAFLNGKVKKFEMYGNAIYTTEKAPPKGGAIAFTIGVYPFVRPANTWSGRADTSPMRSPAMNDFFTLLLRDFKSTTEKIIAAAGMNNSEAERLPAYTLFTAQDREQSLPVLQQRLDEVNGENTWMQLVRTMSMSQQMTKDILGSSISTSRGDMKVLQAFPSAAQSSSAGESLAIAAGSTVQGGPGGYSGPGASAVKHMLSVATGYSCHPLNIPEAPDQFNCVMRDGAIYKARSIAVAIECSVGTREEAKIAKYLPMMKSELQVASDSCHAATNSPQCTTASLLSCGDIDRLLNQIP